jgi:hypothetical protein
MGSPITRRGPNSSTRRKARTPMQVVDPGVGGRGSGSCTPPHAAGPLLANAFRCTPMLRKAVPGESHNAQQPPAYAAVAPIRHALAPMRDRWPGNRVRLRTRSGWVRAGRGAVCRRGAGRSLASEARAAIRRRLRSGRPARAWTGRARASWARSSGAAGGPGRAAPQSASAARGRAW